MRGVFSERSMNENEVRYARQRLVEIDNLRPEIEAELTEAKENFTNWLTSTHQAPRMHQTLWKRFQSDQGGDALQSRIDRLEAEKRAILKAIERAEKAIKQRAREQLKNRARGFNERVRAVCDELKQRPKWANAVISLASEGKSLEELGRPLAQAIRSYQDLAVLRRSLLEEDDGLNLSKIPEIDITEAKEILRATEALFGRPIELRLNRKVHRLKADQRGRDLDLAVTK